MDNSNTADENRQAAKALDELWRDLGYDEKYPLVKEPFARKHMVLRDIVKCMGYLSPQQQQKEGE